MDESIHLSMFYMIWPAICQTLTKPNNLATWYIAEEQRITKCWQCSGNGNSAQQ